MKQTFYSNGKLLLTGEYTVLDGAHALALPTKGGQYLDVEPGDGKIIEWNSFDSDNTLWYSDKISFREIETKLLADNKPERNTLITILHEAFNANPVVINTSEGFKVTTQLTFPRQWGLGSSSTLINNIANWFETDPFELLNRSFGGSGYDIACARNNNPIIYYLKENYPVIEHVAFQPLFRENLYFVYLNKKQNSRAAIENYKSNRTSIESAIAQINALTQRVLKAKDLISFKTAVNEHEAIMAQILGTKTVQEQLFADFTGIVKSLGAWGGDFILAANESDPTAYFKEKGYNTVIPFDKMILK